MVQNLAPAFRIQINLIHIADSINEISFLSINITEIRSVLRLWLSSSLHEYEFKINATDGRYML